MGWGRWLLLGDLGQQMDLSEQQEKIANQEERMDNLLGTCLGLKNKLAEKECTIGNTEAALIRLQGENDQLKLYLAAVVRILIDQGLTSRQDIKRLVTLIDGEDGAEDGKLTGDII